MISSTLHSLLTISIILTFTYFSDSIQGLGLLEPKSVINTLASQALFMIITLRKTLLVVNQPFGCST